ncbi:tRNA 2-selenouridine(34) synthase MnmH [Rhodospirillaceae bacterium]|nr:tRNA 2-selenouridine(34) synthase MnmH [Rhodospirillaceae bacterium]MDC1441974.1 tRNA 2-selenouridine(34) synthase MnmH [Rhodospirillaceae bacterium]
MSPPIKYTTDYLSPGFTAIIDVRSATEYAEDHIPGAINMPVLNDAERAEVGTMYKQVGSFEAKRRGAALVSRNISYHLETELANAPRNFSPLIYCWRGGQRSRAMAQILSEIGWKVTLLEGGYKTYRKQVLVGLDEIPATLRPIILRGRTGLAKTRILRAAAKLGTQVIDLEGLAAHRGSLLGSVPGFDQPSQRKFESRIFDVMRQLDPVRRVVIEAESNNVGACHVPAELWRSMGRSQSIQITAPIAARVEFLLGDYQHLMTEPERLNPLLDWVAARVGKEAVLRWRKAISDGDWTGFVTSVLEDHYDPAYDRSAAKHGHKDICLLKTKSLDAIAVAQLAEKLAAII